MRNNKISSKVMAYGFAGLTTLVGVLSFGIFGRFLSEMGLGTFQFGLSKGKAAAFDVALCLAFFLQHSGMVRRPFRRWSERWIPSYLSGALYTFASAFALVLLCVLWQAVDPTPWPLDGRLRALLRVVPFLALLGFAWAIVSLEGFDAFGTNAILMRLRQRDPAPSQLAVKGPYRWVRHPFYFLALVLLWISPTISWDRLLLNVLFTVWIVLGARWEERDLVDQFGDAYRRIQREVPMLIPWRLPVADRVPSFGS